MRKVVAVFSLLLANAVIVLVVLGMSKAYAADDMAGPAGRDPATSLVTSDTGDASRLADFGSIGAGQQPLSPGAPCGGGPVIDGITLNECFVHNLTVGGNARTITVWYTKNPVTATRMVDGSPVVLSHWINTDAQAVQVAQWFEEAWQRYYADTTSSGETHELYINGCSNNLNVQMEDGVGWSGIAYWASSGNCNIGIDSPMVRNGGGQRTVYHEAQHYLQYDYDNGCYGSWQPNYPSNSEYVEGYADFGSNSVDATVDSNYQVTSYNPSLSLYDEGYGNLFLHFWTQQVGTLGTPAEPRYHVDAMYNHYEECDDQNSLYVLDDVILAMSGGALNLEKMARNFFASLYAAPTGYTDPTVQSQIAYSDADDNNPTFPGWDQSATLSSGSQAWNGQSSPDDWAARYYRVIPSGSCKFVQVEVDGTSGANLGISMFAKNNSAASLIWRAWQGEDATRTFAGAGTHSEIVAVVNSFATIESYDVTFSCVSPTVNILEPRTVNQAQIGAADAPIAFLARLDVKSGGKPVLGLEESDFEFLAVDDGDPSDDTLTVSPGSFQQVGDEYWVTLISDPKPAGTIRGDFRVCLAGTICDAEDNDETNLFAALLYIDPGNKDVGYVFDESGSMAFVDGPAGSDPRYLMAIKAGEVDANTLRVGDRVRVSGFSAVDNPPGCGLPPDGSGDGNCPLDITQYMARTDVVGQATINAANTAMGSIFPDAWTPIGAALDDCKNALLAGPSSPNPKHCVLLSDGEENVNPLYADIQAGLIASGVVVDTICFGPSCPGGLLSQIASDTGGSYRPVPTTPTGLLSAAEAAQLSADRAELLAEFSQSSPLPAELKEQFSGIMLQPTAAQVLPGHLGLSHANDLINVDAQEATQIFHKSYLVVPDNTWQEFQGIVDQSVSRLQFTVAGQQLDAEGCGYTRRVEILQPKDQGNQRAWIPISPEVKSPAPPTNWDIRNDGYVDVLIVTNPDPGTWSIRTKYFYTLCTAPELSESPSAPLVLESDFIMNMNVQSTHVLRGFIRNLPHMMGKAGDTVIINGQLLQRDGPIKTLAAMGAFIDKPGATDTMLLYDDGNHDDGSAGDGVFGAEYSLTTVGGSYSVRLVALFFDPNDPGTVLAREWNGGFWIEGPSLSDGDKDRLPDDWERRCWQDVQAYGAADDPDRDQLNNFGELQNGTSPCDPDTDDGGEMDGSEVRNQRNPLVPNDDQVRKLGFVGIRPLNSAIVVQWTRPLSFTDVIINLSTVKGSLGQDYPTGGSSTGVFSITQLTNDTPYYVRVQPVVGNAAGPYSPEQEVMPKADPDAPSGWLLIENDMAETAERQVMLYISSSDTPPDGAIQGANAHQTDRWSLLNDTSGNVEMRISNSPTMDGAAWEPLAATKPWLLGCNYGTMCRVYAQFRDGAMNESTIIFDDIFLQPRLFLPVIIH